MLSQANQWAAMNELQPDSKLDFHDMQVFGLSTGRSVNTTQEVYLTCFTHSSLPAVQVRFHSSHFCFDLQHTLHHHQQTLHSVSTQQESTEFMLLCALSWSSFLVSALSQPHVQPQHFLVSVFLTLWLSDVLPQRDVLCHFSCALLNIKVLFYHDGCV